jgi:bifunctional DNA-binding transcriptional regulator/antitoxin component of YhaV-PrlF toxin-antitoxin module
MSFSTAKAVQITEEGMLPIPRDLWDVLGLGPAQIVKLRQQEGSLLVQPLSPEEIGEQIISLLKDALGDTTWNDIMTWRNQDEDWR